MKQTTRENREFPDQVELLILGAGISGATLFSVASCSGKACLLVDRGDYASGTSQSTGMMIWGGLLYLKNLDIGLVTRLCTARDWLIRHCPRVVERRFTYLPSARGGRSRWLMYLGLVFYRVLSGFKRAPLKSIPLDQLPPSWEPSHLKSGLSYEEAFLKDNDSQYTFDWLRQHDGPGLARNYCEPVDIAWDAREGLFRVRLRDHIAQCEREVTAERIVNCCGVWADQINLRFGIDTLHRHFLSKGVYLLLKPKDKEAQDALAVDMGQNGDTLCWVPWGPVVMWGPTETDLDSLDAVAVEPADIEFLLGRINHESRLEWTEADIINVRVGVRPLPILPGQKIKCSLDLSRKAILEATNKLPWWTMFGGKLSGEYQFALRTFQNIFKEPATVIRHWKSSSPEYCNDYFGGFSIKSPRWCAAEEQVYFLEDYLRRRTNIAQWVARGGFGQDGEYVTDIYAIALEIHDDAERARQDFESYRQKVINEEKTWKSPRFWADLPPLPAMSGNLPQASAGPI